MRYNRADATRKDHDRKTRDNSEDSELLGLGLGIDVTIYVSSDIYVSTSENRPDVRTDILRGFRESK